MYIYFKIYIFEVKAVFKGRKEFKNMSQLILTVESGIMLSFQVYNSDNKMNCLWATLVCVLAFCLGAHSQVN